MPTDKIIRDWNFKGQRFIFSKDLNFTDEGLRYQRDWMSYHGAQNKVRTRSLLTPCHTRDAAPTLYNCWLSFPRTPESLVGPYLSNAEHLLVLSVIIIFRKHLQESVPICTPKSSSFVSTTGFGLA